MCFQNYGDDFKKETLGKTQNRKISPPNILPGQTKSWPWFICLKKKIQKKSKTFNLENPKHSFLFIPLNWMRIVNCVPAVDLLDIWKSTFGLNFLNKTLNIYHRLFYWIQCNMTMCALKSIQSYNIDSSSVASGLHSSVNKFIFYSFLYDVGVKCGRVFVWFSARLYMQFYGLQMRFMCKCSLEDRQSCTMCDVIKVKVYIVCVCGRCI